MGGGPVGPAEHAAVEVTSVEIGVLVGSLFAPTLQDTDGGGVEVDAAAGGARLASGLVEVVADGHQ